MTEDKLAAEDAGWWRERKWNDVGEGESGSGTSAAASLVPQFHFISSLLLFNFI